jgi:putative transposase
MLAREGHALNHKKLYRLYREERLMVRRRRGRKRALGTRTPITLPSAINQRWSLDFVSYCPMLWIGGHDQAASLG